MQRGFGKILWVNPQPTKAFSSQLFLYIREINDIFNSKGFTAMM